MYFTISGQVEWIPLETRAPNFHYFGKTFSNISLFHQLVILGDTDELSQKKKEILPSLLNATCQMEAGGGHIYTEVSLHPGIVATFPLVQVTAVWLACHLRHWSLASLLISLKADTNLPAIRQEGNEKISALYETIEKGEEGLETLKKLLEAKAQLAIGKNPLLIPLHPNVRELLESTGKYIYFLIKFGYVRFLIITCRHRNIVTY